MACWVKSLHCKSRALDDVIPLPSPSCRNSYQSLSDVILPSSPKPKPKPKPNPTGPFLPTLRSSSLKPKPIPSGPSNRVKRSVSAPIKSLPVPEPIYPMVSELQVGHPSRNVVEIIFRTRWGPRGFTGRVETVLKVRNMAHTLSSYEEYRHYVKSRVGVGCCTDDARCSADGNEMMRFRCIGPASSTSALFGGAHKGATSDDGCCVSTTYSGSGAAHDSAGGGKGRRAMLVCRVIAGRVGSEEGKRVGFEFDSVSKENGELLVFDARAVLPCFLVIYKL